MWTRLPPGADLGVWWQQQPGALPWPDVPVHTVSAWCIAWQHLPVATLAAAYAPAGAVLVVAESAAGTDVYGLVSLRAPRASHCGGALEHRADLALETAVPPLAHLTLEHTWCRRPHVLADVVMDTAAERPLIARAISTVVDIARGRAADVEAWPADAAGQLDCAKMRYYVRLCLTAAPVLLDVQRTAHRIGAEALGAWTAAIVRRHVTSEKRCAQVVADERLPLQVVAPTVAPPVATCSCGRVPLPQHIDEPGALAAMYAVSADERASPLTRGSTACAPKAGGRWALISGGAIELNPYAYGARLPASMFVVVSPGGRRPSVAELLAALYLHGWAPPAAHGLSELWLPCGDAMLWAVPELVWASGAALGTFVRGVWAWPSAWDYDVDGTLSTPFTPHPHVAWPRHAPRAQRRTAATWTAGGGSAMRLRAADGATMAWQALPTWVGEAVTADTLRAHGTAPPLAAIAAAVKLAMGSQLFTALSTIASYTVTQTAARDSVEVFGSSDYQRIESWVAERRDRLEAFFTDLTAPAKVCIDGEVRVRADGHLTLVVEGPRVMQWKDFSTRNGGGGRGCTLGSLITYRLDGATGDSALHWLERWADTRAQQEALADTDQACTPPQHAEAPPAPADTMAARAKIAGRLAHMTRVDEQTAAWRYLRETRGLADAPRALIEENPALCASARGSFHVNDDTALPCALLGCITAGQIGMQLIHLDAATARKLTAPDGSALPDIKRTHGLLRLGVGRYDAVPIAAAPADEAVERVFVAEGPETALSVAAAFPGTPVYAALGVGFIGGFGDVAAAEVVICRENDAGAAHIERMLRAARTALSTRFRHVREVWPPSGYNDFNDVHQQHPGAAGTAIIRTHIDAQLLRT